MYWTHVQASDQSQKKQKKKLRQCKFPGILILNQVSDKDEMHKQNIYKQHENTEIMQETRKWQGLSGRTLWIQANFKLACLRG